MAQAHRFECDVMQEDDPSPGALSVPLIPSCAFKERDVPRRNTSCITEIYVSGSIMGGHDESAGPKRFTRRKSVCRAWGLSVALRTFMASK